MHKIKFVSDALTLCKCFSNKALDNVSFETKIIQPEQIAEWQIKKALFGLSQYAHMDFVFLLFDFV